MTETGETVEIMSGRGCVLTLVGWAMVELMSFVSFGVSPTALVVLICFGISL